MSNMEFESMVNGAKVKLRLKPENLDIERKCDTEYHIAFTELMQRGVLPKATLERLMSEKGIWTEEQEKLLTELQHKLAALQIALDKAETHEKGLSFAKNMGDLRNQCLRLIEVKSAVFVNSCESLADSVRRDAYIAYALVYADTGKYVFKNYQEFISRADEPVVLDARRLVLEESIKAFQDSVSGLPELAYIKKVEGEMTAAAAVATATAVETQTKPKTIRKRTKKTS